MARVGAVEEAGTAAVLVPPKRSLEELRRTSATCRACPLWRTGTQTVFGEGAPDARVMFVGEVPGNDEDLAGRPFVGPAGKFLDKVLDEVGIDRREIYVTNAVKHFKWEPAGKRRIHKKPNAREIAACRPWLEAEIEVIQPTIIVCLGATAAQTLLGRNFRVTKQRGEPVSSPLADFVMATVHPSSILRAPDEAQRRAVREAFVADMKKVAAIIHRETR